MLINVVQYLLNEQIVVTLNIHKIIWSLYYVVENLLFWLTLLIQKSKF